MKIPIPWFLQKRINKAKRQVEVWYLNARVARINKPVVAVTGSVGKTTTSQLIAHILSRDYSPVGLSCTQGVWIGDRPMRAGDSSGSLTALRLINDASTKAVVCEVARGGLLDIGMVVKNVDVSVFLNVRDNHLGIGVLKTREDIARTKSLVTAAATKAIVVNADDELCLKYTEHAKAKERYLVSCDRNNPSIATQQRQGGFCILVNETEVEMMRGFDRIVSIPCSQIQDSYGGRYHPAMLCTAFAVGAAHAVGVSPDKLGQYVSDFASSPERNPGRMNFIKKDGIHALVTWADGPDPMKEISKLVSTYQDYKEKVLMMAPMANRPDDFIRGMARETIGVFDKYICSDWQNLRGKPQYHAPHLLIDELLAAGVKKENIALAEAHEPAVDQLLRMAAPGRLLVAVSMSSKQIVDTINQRFGSH